MRKITLDAIKSVSKKAGYYYLYNRNKKKIYIGVSHDLQHRLFALYYGRADYAQIKGKDKLRRAAFFFSVRYMSIAAARKFEKSHKSKLQFNAN